jgi:hypothetical protein
VIMHKRLNTRQSHFCRCIPPLSRPVESQPESQRDSVTKPKVARNELPWDRRCLIPNPNGVAANSRLEFLNRYKIYGTTKISARNLPMHWSANL